MLLDLRRPNLYSPYIWNNRALLLLDLEETDIEKVFRTTAITTHLNRKEYQETSGSVTNYVLMKRQWVNFRKSKKWRSNSHDPRLGSRSKDEEPFCAFVSNGVKSAPRSTVCIPYSNTFPSLKDRISLEYLNAMGNLQFFTKKPRELHVQRLSDFQFSCRFRRYFIDLP